MSGAGAPRPAVVDGSALRVAVISASWHEQVVEGLRGGAQRALAESNVQSVDWVRVPGAFELSVAAASLAASYDAIVALGVVIRGGTPHFDFVCEGVTYGLSKVSVESRTPVGFGVLTCDDEQQALDRAGLAGSVEDKGYEAASAAISTALALAAAHASSSIHP
jgi:6,7-dimethyl-8-ribityllumazine synthase